MYLYIYIYIYICIYIYTHIHTHTYVNAYVHVCIDTHDVHVSSPPGLVRRASLFGSCAALPVWVAWSAADFETIE